MTKSFNGAGLTARTRCLSVAAFVLALGLYGAPAAAEEGLFDFDPGRWMSSQRYSDNLKKHPPKEEESEKAEVAPPALPQDAVENEAKAQPVPEPSKVEEKRILSKSYSYLPPPMPGVNNGFTVRVTSTDDPDTAEKPPSASTISQTDEEEVKPKEIVLPDNWKAPTNMAAGNDDDADKEKPLNVRMSVLPTPSAVPAPVAGQDRPKRARAQAKKPEKTKEQIAQEKAACDAFEKLKKQQLDAIQSDRETLKALQDAVHSLGLAKKMDFRPENGSVLIGIDEDTGPLVPRGTPVPKGR